MHLSIYRAIEQYEASLEIHIANTGSDCLTIRIIILSLFSSPM